MSVLGLLSRVVRRAGLVGLALAAGAACLPARGGTVADCTALTQRVGLAEVKQTEAAGSDGCVYRDVVLSMTPFQRLHAESVTVQRIDFAQVASGDLPATLRIEAHGVSFRYGGTNKIVAYINSVVSRTFDVVLDYRFDTEQGPLRVDRVSLESASLGSFFTSFVVEGLGRRTLADGHDLEARARLRGFSLRFTNLWMFEAFLVPFAAPTLLSDTSDPAAQAEALKAQAAARLTAALVQAGVGAESIGALARFIASLPHPVGTLAVEAAFDPPLTVAEVEAAAAGTPPRLEGGRSLKATYP